METARLRLRCVVVVVVVDRLKLFWQFRRLLWRELAIKAAINSL